MPTHTHEVFNQSCSLPATTNGFHHDPALVQAITQYGGLWAEEQLSTFGAVVLSEEAEELAYNSNHHSPQLKAFDRFGHRIDEVDFHPSYHRVMSLGSEAGVHSFSWQHQEKPGAFVARAGLHYLHCQLEAGTACPLTMTHAAIFSLKHNPTLYGTWAPKLLANSYDPVLKPIDEKATATVGMAMTEKQGGSDVQSNKTAAVENTDGSFSLTGHKWFCSAPMSDAFLTLAQDEVGLSCFFVPRVLPDGSKNPFFVQRIKNKLGNKSNASSEIEYRNTQAIRVGAPGRGVPTIIEMVGATRVDVALSAAGLMRQAVRYSVHHANNRSAFGDTLIRQPLMRNVLADMALETEAAVALSFRVAAAQGAAVRGDQHQAAFARVAMAVAKYWLSKRVIGIAAEALECHGGNGYAEDWPLARLYREAPLGSVWEGSGNVQCLDVLRSMTRSPASMAAVQTELRGFQGLDSRLDVQLERVLTLTQQDPKNLQFVARTLTEKLAICLQAGLLINHAPEPVATAFLQTRLGGGGAEYGTLPVGVDTELLISRAGL